MEDQIEISMEIAVRLFEWSLQEADLLLKISAGTESWVFICNPKSEVNLLKGTWEHPPETEGYR
jgi:hypothetical protein